MEAFNKDYERSIRDPEGFWGDYARTFYWKDEWAPGKTHSFNFDRRKGPVFVKWFEGGRTNLCYNALDRHAAENGERTAIIWEGNDGEEQRWSFSQLLAAVCRFGNALRNKGVKKGDRVTIYMPMVVELAVAMLACARIGAVHSVVFGGFSADALAKRMVDADSDLLVTCDGVMRGAKMVPLLQISNDAMDLCSKKSHAVRTCIVLERLGAERVKVPRVAGRDFDFHALCAAEPAECAIEWVDAEDPLFLLYTSGSTGSPKGVMHTTGGYMIYSQATFSHVFDYTPGARKNANDVYWCTADCGWITGHTYIVYGPLLAGATTMMFEGTPTYPDASKLWQLCEKHSVTQFYTAPTAIRSLMKHGDEVVTKHDLSALKVLGSVGEPINPEAWHWYADVVGGGRCPVVDTYWQTETGGHALTPLANVTPTKPGSATFPFFGVECCLINPETGKEVPWSPGNVISGHLCMKNAWPGMMRGLGANAKDQARYEEVYFSTYEGYYFTGDGCRRDEEGYYWITGRVDDILIVSGHNIGTAEVETALCGHADGSMVAEAAAVGVPHDIKGNAVYVYVTLKAGVEGTAALKADLRGTVAKALGKFAAPDTIHWAPALPKTRSGKIMRRILRKIADPGIFSKMQATGDRKSALGDTSTLADPAVVDALIASREPVAAAKL